MPSQLRVRSCCITWNNYQKYEPEKAWLWVLENCTYAVFGREVSPPTEENNMEGTPHWQGYFEFTSQKSVATIKKHLEGCHVEKPYENSTPRHCAGYCKKGTFSEESLTKDEYINFVKNGKYSYFFMNPYMDWSGEEFGKISNQGKRTDIDNAVESIAAGDSMRTVFRDHARVAVKYHRGLQAVRWAYMEPRKLDEMPTVYVYWGLTGVGKTRRAMEDFEDEDRYVWNPSQGTWFDGYDGEKIIVFDEFRGQLPFAMLLNICDRHSCRVQVKGGMVELQADKIIFTSCKHPRDWYQCFDDQEKYDQLDRRITKTIRLLNGPFQAGTSGVGGS